MAGKDGMTTITADELRKAMAADGTPRKNGAVGDEIHEYAVALLHTMRGLGRRDKRSVLRRAGKLLSS